MEFVSFFLGILCGFGLCLLSVWIGLGKEWMHGDAGLGANRLWRKRQRGEIFSPPKPMEFWEEKTVTEHGDVFSPAPELFGDQTNASDEL